MLRPSRMALKQKHELTTRDMYSAYAQVFFTGASNVHKKGERLETPTEASTVRQ